MQHFLRGVFLKFSRRRPSRSAACADSPTVRFSALHHWHGARQCAPLTGMFETAWQWSRGQCLQQSSYPRRNNRQLPRPIPRRDSARCRKVPRLGCLHFNGGRSPASASFTIAWRGETISRSNGLNKWLRTVAVSLFFVIILQDFFR